LPIRTVEVAKVDDKKERKEDEGGEEKEGEGEEGEEGEMGEEDEEEGTGTEYVDASLVSMLYFFLSELDMLKVCCSDIFTHPPRVGKDPPMRDPPPTQCYFFLLF